MNEMWKRNCIITNAVPFIDAEKQKMNQTYETDK